MTPTRAIWILVGVAIIATGWSLTNRPGGEPQAIGKNCSEASLAEKVEAADLIIQGSVFVVLPSEDGVDVVISPERLYDGRIPAGGIRIAATPATEGDQTSSSDDRRELHFSSDQSAYLLFLRARSDGRFDTRVCFGSRVLGSGLTAEEQSILGPGSQISE